MLSVREARKISALDLITEGSVCLGSNEVSSQCLKKVIFSLYKTLKLRNEIWKWFSLLACLILVHGSLVMWKYLRNIKIIISLLDRNVKDDCDMRLKGKIYQHIEFWKIESIGYLEFCMLLLFFFFLLFRVSYPPIAPCQRQFSVLKRVKHRFLYLTYLWLTSSATNYLN